MKKAIILHTHVAGLGVIRALGSLGVPIVAMHYEEREMGYLSRYVWRSERIPRPDISEEETLAYLLDRGKVYEGSLLIPTNDYTVSLVARFHGRLKQCYTVAQPPWPTTQKVLVKKYTYRIADRLGIPHPRSRVVHRTRDLDPQLDQIDFPYLIKPCEVHKFFEIFGKKMFEVKDRKEALVLIERCRDHGLDVIIQEYIPGDDTSGINYNAYFIDGEPVAEFTARKVRLDPPRFGSPRVLISEQIPEILDLGRRLIRSIGFDGYSCTEFKKDARDGVYKLMEVNGRHNLSTALAVRCGMNFPWLMYQHLCYQNILSIKSFRSGIYWIDLCKDVTHSLLSRRQENFSIMDYVRPYLKCKVFAVLSARDPLPLIRRLHFILLKAVHQVKKAVLQKLTRKTGTLKGEFYFINEKESL